MSIMVPEKLDTWCKLSNILFVTEPTLESALPPSPHQLTIVAVQLPLDFANLSCAGPGVPYSIIAFIMVAESTGTHGLSLDSSVELVAEALSVVDSFFAALLHAVRRRAAAQMVKVMRFIKMF